MEPAQRGMTTGWQTGQDKHPGGWSRETWRVAKGGAGRKVGEMDDYKPVQLAHVEGVTLVDLVVDNKQSTSRPHSAGFYHTTVTGLLLSQRWSKMFTEVERLEVYRRVREGGSELGVRPMVVNGVEGAGAVVRVVEDGQVIGLEETEGIRLRTGRDKRRARCKTGGLTGRDDRQA